LLGQALLRTRRRNREASVVHAPSAFEPESTWGAIRMLASIAIGRMPRQALTSG
jgi:hypothetical protein